MSINNKKEHTGIQFLYVMRHINQDDFYRSIANETEATTHREVIMKKRFVCTITILALSLNACGGQSASNPTVTASVQETETTPPESSQSELSSLDAIGDINVEKELFDVIITLPAEFVGETTQEELEEDAKEIGYKVQINEDGSATYTMTKSQHKQLMEELRSSLNESLLAMVGSEEYPTFTKVEANDDFTVFTVTLNSTELGLAESISVLGFYMYGGIYNIFNGTEVDNIHVEFINSESGEIIYSSDSSEMSN